MSEWKEFSREEINQFIIEYGLNPKDFVFCEDDEERFEEVFYDDLAVGLIRDAFNNDDIYDNYHIDLVRWGMSWCRDSWCGPVKYIRAVMPIKVITNKGIEK